MNASFATNVLKYVQLSSVLAKRALDSLTVKEAAEKRAASQAPGVLQYMLENGVIADNQKQAAAQMLADHEKTLTLLKNAVDRIAKLKQENAVKVARDLGQPESAGTDTDAGETPTMSNYVGRRSSEKTAADVALFRGLGLPV